MDTPNIFENNKFYQHIALHVHEEKQLKRSFGLKNAKKCAVCDFEGNLCFSGMLIIIKGKFEFLLDKVKLL